MDAQLLYFSLCFIALVLAFNLFLTFALAKRLDAAGLLVPQVKKTSLVDTKIAAFSASKFSDGATLTLPAANIPTVWLFLSSQCPKCRQTLPDLDAILLPCQRAGVHLQLLSLEPRKQIASFLGNSTLTEHCFMLKRKPYLALNPTRLSPAYLFINHLGFVEAEGMIGDENWLSFCQQLSEDSADTLAESPL